MMAMAHNNLTVSREVYETIWRRKEQMHVLSKTNPHMRRNNRPPTLNDALASIINESLTEGQYNGRRFGKKFKKDYLAREISKTLIE